MLRHLTPAADSVRKEKGLDEFTAACRSLTIGALHARLFILLQKYYRIEPVSKKQK
jgi:hypothetical protein